MLSATTVPVRYELWLYAKPDFRMPLQSCGVFESEEDACYVGRRVRDWLKGHRWSPILSGVLEGDDKADLEGLPDFLTRLCGVDPALVLITARPFAGANDNAPLGACRGEHFDLDRPRYAGGPDDDGDPDATTPLEVVTTKWERG